MCQAFSEVRFPPFPAARSVISLRPGCLAIAHRRPTHTIWLGTYGEIVAVRTCGVRDRPLFTLYGSSEDETSNYVCDATVFTRPPPVKDVFAS